MVTEPFLGTPSICAGTGEPTPVVITSSCENPLFVRECAPLDLSLIEALLTQAVALLVSIDATLDDDLTEIIANLEAILLAVQNQTVVLGDILTEVQNAIDILIDIEANTDDIEVILTSILNAITGSNAVLNALLDKMNEPCSGNPQNVNVCNQNPAVDLSVLEGLLSSILAELVAINSNTDDLEALIASLIVEVQTGNVNLSAILTALNNMLAQLVLIEDNTDDIESLIATLTATITAEFNQTQVLLQAIVDKLSETCAGDPIKVEVCGEEMTDLSEYEVECAGGTPTTSLWLLLTKCELNGANQCNISTQFPGLVQVADFPVGAGATHPTLGFSINNWNGFALCAATQPVDDGNGAVWIPGVLDDYPTLAGYTRVDADPVCAGGNAQKSISVDLNDCSIAELSVEIGEQVFEALCPKLDVMIDLLTQILGTTDDLCPTCDEEPMGMNPCDCAVGILTAHSDWAARSPQSTTSVGFYQVRGYSGTGTVLTSDISSVLINGVAASTFAMSGVYIEIPLADLNTGINSVEVFGTDSQGLTFSFLEQVEYDGSAVINSNSGNGGFNIDKGEFVIADCKMDIGTGCPPGISYSDFTIGSSSFANPTPCGSSLGDVIVGINDISVEGTATNGPVYMKAQLQIDCA